MKCVKFGALILLPALVTFWSCKEEKLGPLNGADEMPGAVSNVQVQNLPGGAKLTYTLPKSQSLLYVKAQYELNGQKYEERASYFNNNLTVLGFGNTDEREVKLIAVSRGEQESAPISVKIKPLTPPVESIYQSLVIRPTFGGPNVSYLNASKAKVVIEILMDSSGVWLSRDAEYTELEAGNFSSRGLPPVERKFGFFVRDRWNNRSDTLEMNLTPVPEEELGMPTYKRNAWAIPQRPPVPASGSPMVTPANLSSWTWDKMFNGVVGNEGFHTNEKLDLPIWLPFELKEKTKLSRFKIWQRQSGYIFDHGNPHRWEIWGTNTPTDTSSWVLMGSYVMVKPSGGESTGAQTSMDTQVAADGQEYDFLVDAPAVKYLAWKNIDSWGNIGGEKGHFHLSELKLWGLPQP
ncbi:MAG: DUF4959 domain-containing protein [Chitinophagaceae bacterium]|nr:DUF4959 domain-containing protein [Chitinophagaceae bacterium]